MCTPLHYTRCQKLLQALLRGCFQAYGQFPTTVWFKQEGVWMSAAQYKECHVVTVKTALVCLQYT
jgi:hypothetical protein